MDHSNEGFFIDEHGVPRFSKTPALIDRRTGKVLYDVSGKTLEEARAGMRKLCGIVGPCPNGVKNCPFYERAIKNNCVQCVKSFIDQNIDLVKTPIAHLSPLEIAVMYDSVDIAKLLVNYGANSFREINSFRDLPRQTKHTLLHTAVHANNTGTTISVNMWRFLFELGLDISEKDCYNKTVLDWTNYKTREMLKNLYDDVKNGMDMRDD